MDFQEINKILIQKKQDIGCLVSSHLCILFEYFFKLIYYYLFRSVLVSDFIISNMSDKKASATATSATKKASVAAKKPATTTPASPKAEVYSNFSSIPSFDSINK
jgi:hypothetical protein